MAQVIGNVKFEVCGDLSNFIWHNFTISMSINQQVASTTIIAPCCRFEPNRLPNLTSNSTNITFNKKKRSINRFTMHIFNIFQYFHKEWKLVPSVSGHKNRIITTYPREKSYILMSDTLTKLWHRFCIENVPLLHLAIWFKY